MERCAYCGQPVGDSPIELGDETFCSEGCVEDFETGEGEDDYYSDDSFGDEDAMYDY